MYPTLPYVVGPTFELVGSLCLVLTRSTFHAATLFSSLISAIRETLWTFVTIAIRLGPFRPHGSVIVDGAQLLRDAGLTIVVSTPYMDEAVRCQRVALMQQGRLLGVDAPAAITAGYDRPLVAVRAAERFRLIRALRELPHARSVHAFGETVHFTDERVGADPRVISAELVAALRDRGFSDVAAEPVAATIEDSFMALMGEAEAA